MKKKKTLIRYLGLMIALIAGCLPTMADTGSSSNYYSKVTAKATGAGKVYVSYKNDSNNLSEHATTSEASSGADSKTSAPTHKYYLYASGGTGEPIWKEGNTEVDRGEKISVSVTAAEDVANATRNFTMHYAQLYSKVSGTCSSGANVFVSSSSSDHGTAAELTQGGKASQTYYLYTDGTAGTPIWATADGTEIGRSNPQAYTVTAESEDANEPTTFNVKLSFEKDVDATFPYTYVENGVSYGELTYKSNSDYETATLQAHKGNTTLTGKIIVPEKVYDSKGNEFTVTAAAGGAFQNCTNITDVVIKAPIATLGYIQVKTSDYSNIASSSVSISKKGAGLFVGCSNLKTVNMKACKFKSTDGGGGEYGGMFGCCTSLTSVTMPDELERLDGADFMFTKALVTVDLSNTKLKYIGEYTFGMKSISSSDPDFTKHGGYYYYNYGVQNVYLPEGTLETIEKNAFLYNMKLQRVTDLGNRDVPTAEQKEKYPYLRNCTSLVGVCHMPSVTSIGEYAFNRTYASAKAWILSGVKSVPQKVFTISNQTHTHVFNAGLVKISDEALKNNHLDNICYDGMDYEILTNSTIKIDGRVATGTGILPPSLTTIGSNAIGETGSAFYIKELYLPSSLTSYGTACFNKANSIQNVYAYGSKPTVKNFSEVPSGAVLHIHPDASESNLTLNNLFTVKKDLGHKHNFKAGWNTLTLASHAKQVSGLSYYTISRKAVNAKGEVTKLFVKPVPADELLKGGVPYIVKATQDKANVLFDYEYGHLFLYSADTNVNGMTGTLEEAATGLSNVLTFSNGAPATDATSCEAYSAYVDLSKVSTGEAVEGEEEIVLKEDSYKLTYVIGSEIVSEQEYEAGATITAADAPAKTGYTFAGWTNLPATMPENDLTVTGSYTINTYQLVFKVGEDVVSSTTVEYASAIAEPAAPEKEGHTFAGWSEHPETMPASDLTITGSYTVNKYQLTFKVGEYEQTSVVEYASAITEPETPEVEGYTFMGWSEHPATMPAHDLTITGTYAENYSYFVINYIDEEATEAGEESEVVTAIDPETGDEMPTVSIAAAIKGTSNAPRRARRKVDLNSDLINRLNLYEGDVVVNDKVNIDGTEYLVTGIKPNAFAYQYKMTSITLPASIENAELTTLPMNVNGFDMDVKDASGYFYMCWGLESATINFQAEDLGAGCFFGCYNLKNVILPSNLKKISDGMFVGCYSLGLDNNQELDLSNTQVEEVGYLAFYRNGVPSGATTYDDEDFKKYFNNTKAELEAKMGETTWSDYEGRGIKKIKLPNKVKTLKYGAFEECIYLTQVTTSNDATVSDLSSVEEMGMWVFADCHALNTDVILNNKKLISLPANTFTRCESLKKATLPSTMKEISKRAFDRCTSLKTIACGSQDEEGTFNLPSSLEHIAMQAFQLTAPEKIVFPSSLKRISSMAFGQISSLQSAESSSATAPVLGKQNETDNDTYTDDEENAFNIMSDKFETLDFNVIDNPDAFYEAGNNLPLAIPYGATDSYISKGWNGTYALTAETELALIFTDFAVVDGKATCSLASFQNPALENEVEIPSTYTKNNITYTVNAINYYAFTGCPKITKVIIPNTVDHINKTELYMNVNGFDMRVKESSGIFYMCFNLETVEFEEGTKIDDLGAGCFFGCYNLKAIVNLPKSLTRIADGMFVGCYSLGYGYTDQVLDFSDYTNINEIGYLAFYRNGVPRYATQENNDSEFKKFFYYTKEDIENATGNNNIDWEQYEGRGVKAVILPNTVKGIKYGAFEDACYLTKVSTSTEGTVSNLSCVEKLGQWVFADCPLITEVVLDNENLVSLPAYTFGRCTDLTKVTLPTTMQEISQRAFYECENLKTVASGEKVKEGTIYLPEDMEHVACEAFFYTHGANKLVLPEGLKRISSGAFKQTQLELVISEAATAPVLGKNKSCYNDIYRDNDQSMGTDGDAFQYMSERMEEIDLTTEIASPDVFPTNTDDMTAPVLFVGFSKKSEYDNTPWNDSFYVVEKHERNVTPGNFGTLCIPYSAQIPTGCEFYCASSINYDTESKRVSLELAEVTGLLEAGMPYFFQSSDATSSITMNPADELSFARTPKNENGLHGALADRIEFEDNTEGIYMLKNNKLYKAKTGSICSAYRAYVNIKDIEDNSAQNGSSKRVNIDIELDPNDATAIFGISFGDGKNAVIYDLNGRMQSTATKGIYIINGKKVIK